MENNVINIEERLVKLRATFPSHHINKLPKGTKQQNNCPASEKKNCDVCGGWHHPRVRHLDYVGHAALTDRLLDVDQKWGWEPVAFDGKGLPCLDESGGLWIRLTVCGVTRYGYGHAESKDWSDAGARIKELIGDALRNAAMRFGCALELWHKGDLRLPEAPEAEKPLIITPAQAAGLSLALKDAGGDEAAFLGYFKIDLMNDLPIVQYDKAVAMISSKMKSKKAV